MQSFPTVNEPFRLKLSLISHSVTLEMAKIRTRACTCMLILSVFLTLIILYHNPQISHDLIKVNLIVGLVILLTSAGRSKFLEPPINYHEEGELEPILMNNCQEVVRT